MAIKVHPEPPEEQGPSPCRRCCIGIMRVLLALGLAASIHLLIIFALQEPQYYAAIDAISGLDLTTSKPALDHQLQVEFNLTLGVKSRSWLLSGCFEPGAIVTATYLGVQVADGSTSARACAPEWKPEKMGRMPVVARAPSEGLPALKSLAAADARRRGLAVFDVSLRIPRWNPSKLVVCRGRRVGGVVEESSPPCDVRTSP